MGSEFAFGVICGERDEGGWSEMVGARARVEPFVLGYKAVMVATTHALFTA